MTRDERTSRTETILLVDDDDGVREVTRNMLLEGGYHVITAASGREALRLSRVHSGKIDLLLTDVMMPDMDGPTLAESFARLRAGARVLFISGYNGEAPEDRASSSRTMRVLLKPFSSGQLAHHVRAVLAESQTAQ